MTETWTSRDVERDPAGFLKAQQQERERAEEEPEYPWQIHLRPVSPDAGPCVLPRSP
jgi:hypothetical protein